MFFFFFFRFACTPVKHQISLAALLLLCSLLDVDDLVAARAVADGQHLRTNRTRRNRAHTGQQEPVEAGAAMVAGAGSQFAHYRFFFSFFSFFSSRLPGVACEGAGA